MSDKGTQILEASIDLFAEEGFWNTPTTRIAKHASVGTGTLFNYFGSKEGLIDAVYMQLKKEWGEYILSGWPHNGSIKDQLEHMWFRFIDWAMKYPDRYALKQQLRLSELVNVDTLVMSTGTIREVPAKSVRACRTQIVTEVGDAAQMVRNWGGGVVDGDMMTLLHRVVFYGDHVDSARHMADLLKMKVVMEG